MPNQPIEITPNDIIATVVALAVFIIALAFVFISDMIKENRKMEKTIKQSRENLERGHAILKSIKRI